MKVFDLNFIFKTITADTDYTEYSTVLKKLQHSLEERAIAQTQNPCRHFHY